MTERADCLIEIHTEELPPKALNKLALAFAQQVEKQIQKHALAYDAITFFASPRRIALRIDQLVGQQDEQKSERRGPALQAAFDDQGQPTAACIGFARSCGVAPSDLQVLKNPQGEWLSYQQKIAGKSTLSLLPTLVEQALQALPIPKPMRWGAGNIQFVRPVHSVILLYGERVVEASILGCTTGKKTQGHRFLAPDWMDIPQPSDYASLLETKGFVIANFEQRRRIICVSAAKCVQEALGADAQLLISSDELLDEVTGLVEWPVALCGHFDAAFLSLPQEVLISAMQDHQRYFPVIDAHKQQLLPYFITISNIQSADEKRVIQGNERVLRARLADAAFFYAQDKEESLAERLPRLKEIVYQQKLGSLHDKAERLSHLAASIAPNNQDSAARAAWLAKCDLTTNMVNEFPQLQGVMGGYYARHDGEQADVAAAIKEHYLPRFAQDNLPTTALGAALAIADRIDALIGAFGINQIPTGDKDPYGLRRAAVGIIRILIEKEIELDLPTLLEVACNGYGDRLSNVAAASEVMAFIHERMRAWYQERGISADVFAAVAALHIRSPLDMDKRMQAVQGFKELAAAESLSIANKRVSNMLAKYAETLSLRDVNTDLFEHAAELDLANLIAAKSEEVKLLAQAGHYTEVLTRLAELRTPVDRFFDEVMVMTEDQSRRENRLLLLSQLRGLFLQVADIALLQ